MHCTTKAALPIIAMMCIGALCPNHTAAIDRDDAPESVEIGSLSKLYEPVWFDHAMHADVAECSQCHHHTTGQEPTDERCLKCHAQSGETGSISCADCHTADRFSPEDIKASRTRTYHIDKPGLKGAYHLNCIGCHQDQDGPTGCTDCHALTDKGESFFRVSIVPPEEPSTGHTNEHK